ncbi:hypothetical protein VTL71DRAFT_13526 [Oculimacula yallundae]|uniref:Zn(2)-C6 fungal-type domain-containing protein n=1 Tax=Oculimacula yallundae TaxID=86028 RepID=A0ABR4CKP4_9HELO
MSGQTKKRNRGLLSCTECHRRKQKCDRSQPCGDCFERGLPNQCVYIVPRKANDNSHSGAAETGKAAVSRMRRIMTGEEVILTPESVDALAVFGSVSQPMSTPYETSGMEPRANDTAPSSGLVETDIESMLLQSLQFRPKSPNVVSGLKYISPPITIGGLDPFSVLPETAGEPVPKQLLIRYYIERLAPWLCYLDDELKPDSSRMAWLPFALEHKAFFYATLLTAAVHLNRRRKIRDPSALYWFKIQTIKHANENMNDPEKSATDEMIMVALILLTFNIGGANVEEYEVHLRGIHQMLKVRGGIHRLGMRGMAKNWLAICQGPWREGWEYGMFK